jgi:hypothetical protein
MVDPKISGLLKTWRAGQFPILLDDFSGYKPPFAVSDNLFQGFQP